MAHIMKYLGTAGRTLHRTPDSPYLNEIKENAM